MRVGIIGLGKMGAGIAERLLGAGHEVVGYDRRPEAVERLAGACAASSVEDLVDRLEERRLVWLMLPEGEPVDEALDALCPRLSAGDVVVDGGNSYYRDSRERAGRLGETGIDYLDVGVSGGVWGREHGYCLMIGGSAAGVRFAEPVFRALASSAESGWRHLGPSGSGHFVKMIHNGIEYGIMQAYAEGFSLLEKKREFDLDLAGVGELWRHGSVVRSWLLDLIARALGRDPSLGGLEPFVPDSGEGRWTVREAVELASPAPVITQALFERFASRDDDAFSHKLLAALRHEFGGHPIRRKAGGGGEPGNAAGEVDDAVRSTLLGSAGGRS